MTEALSPQFGKQGSATAPKPPAPISAPAPTPTPTPLALGAGTRTSFQQKTAWRTPEGMPYSAQAGGLSTLNFEAGQSVPAAPMN